MASKGLRRVRGNIPIALCSVVHYCAASLLLFLLFSKGGRRAGPPLPVDPSLDLQGPLPLPVLSLPGPPQLTHVPSSSLVVTEDIPPVPLWLIDKICRWEFVDLFQLLMGSDPGEGSSSMMDGHIILSHPYGNASSGRKPHPPSRI